MKDKQSSPHSQRRCRRHIVFVPKYCRTDMYGKINEDARQAYQERHEGERGRVKETEANQNRIRMRHIAKHRCSAVYGALKRKNSMIIFDGYVKVQMHSHSGTPGILCDTVDCNKKG